MTAFALRHYLPNTLRAPLWGDRERWGLTVQPDDTCWREWQRTHGDLYNVTQRQGIGRYVTDAGYNIMAQTDLTGKRVLEVGAGDIRHIAYWRGQPSEYIIADISPDMLQKAEQRLRETGVAYRPILLTRDQPLPLEASSVDVVISFYSLEHLYPLPPYLIEMRRVLAKGGKLIGAIPAEGGLAWGGGRLLTSRRWFKKNTNIDPDKIICWEHPNFSDEVLAEMDKVFSREKVGYWPINWVKLIDLNLVIKFMYSK